MRNYPDQEITVHDCVCGARGGDLRDRSCLKLLHVVLICDGDSSRREFLVQATAFLNPAVPALPNGPPGIELAGAIATDRLDDGGAGSLPHNLC